MYRSCEYGAYHEVELCAKYKRNSCLPLFIFVCFSLAKSCRVHYFDILIGRLSCFLMRCTEAKRGAICMKRNWQYCASCRLDRQLKTLTRTFKEHI